MRSRPGLHRIKYDIFNANVDDDFEENEKDPTKPKTGQDILLEDGDAGEGTCNAENMDIRDLLDDEVWDYLRDVASTNTAIYTYTFPRDLPHDYASETRDINRIIMEGKTKEIYNELSRKLYPSMNTEVEEDYKDLRGEIEANQLEFTTAKEENEELVLEPCTDDSIRAAWLQRVQGHVIEFPVTFLWKDMEKLEPPSTFTTSYI